MYLVVGANGFLGSYVLKNILEKTEDSVIAVARNIDNVTNNQRIKWVSCDISEREQVDALLKETEDFSSVKVIFLAAYHNPDLVEKNPELAWNINVTSLAYFLNKMNNVESFFYPSTDSVYGNSIDGYHFKESDGLNPVNTYGKQKCAAESIVLWHGNNVVRFPFLISPSLSPVKKHFYDVIKEHLEGGQSIEMFVDSFRSSMSFDTAASILIDLVEKHDANMPQVINICGDDDLSKYDIGLMMADMMQVDRNLIVPVETVASNGIFEAQRATSTLMDNSLLKEVLGIDEVKLIL